MRGVTPSKNVKKSIRQLRNLHYLKDIVLDAFESRKVELKEDDKAHNWFSPLQLHIIPQLGCIPVS